jgi:hypothetical protein
VVTEWLTAEKREVVQTIRKEQYNVERKTNKYFIKLIFKSFGCIKCTGLCGITKQIKYLSRAQGQTACCL